MRNTKIRDSWALQVPPPDPLQTPDQVHHLATLHGVTCATPGFRVMGAARALALLGMHHVQSLHPGTTSQAIPACDTCPLDEGVLKSSEDFNHVAVILVRQEVRICRMLSVASFKAWRTTSNQALR